MCHVSCVNSLENFLALDCCGGLSYPLGLPGQLIGQGCFHDRILASQLDVDEVGHVALQIHLGGQLDAQEQGVEDAQICNTSGWEAHPSFKEGAGQVI